MPYLKVYRSKDPCSVQEVEHALLKDVQGLKVSDDLGDVSVEFPLDTAQSIMQKVEDHLKSQGFQIS